MPVIATRLLDTYYELDGDEGTPIVLVSGLGSSLDAWDVELRDAVAAERRCLVFDNRGTGRSATPPGPYRIEQFAEDGLALLDALELDRVHLVGASMGGLIAQEMALQGGDRLASLTLCCTFAGFSHMTPPAPEVVRILMEKKDMEPAAGVRHTWSISYRPEFIAREREWLEAKLVQETRVPCPPECYQWHLDAAPLWDNGDRLRELRVPTLLLTGEDDVLVPPANSRTLHGLIPGAVLQTYPNSGHCFMTEQRDAVAADILAHAAAHDPARV